MLSLSAVGHFSLPLLFPLSKIIPWTPASVFSTAGHYTMLHEGIDDGGDKDQVSSFSVAVEDVF